MTSSSVKALFVSLQIFLGAEIHLTARDITLDPYVRAEVSSDDVCISSVDASATAILTEVQLCRRVSWGILGRPPTTISGWLLCPMGPRSCRRHFRLDLANFGKIPGSRLSSRQNQMIVDSQYQKVIEN